MKIAVLSGKGGAGKTFVSVNLASAAGHATYIDCDVEEPNGRLFLKPENPEREPVYTMLPAFNETKCIGCRKCVDFCRFNALVFIKDKPMVFPEVCHACGGCALVCPSRAVAETERSVGIIETGKYQNTQVVTGVLNLGEASAIPVIKAALQMAKPKALTIIDCPPGSSCAVMESVADADFCILVAEPTSFGLHNLEMVYELVRLFQKPLGIVINKTDGDYAPLDLFCTQNQIPILCRIPYSEKLAALCAAAQVASLQDIETNKLFTRLLKQVQEVRI
ncbi:MAG TPA: ATP-binding protein [Oscillospiraceae bacterium]|mgnify:CR=1 FL=1|nr:ATP-binding protein [Oscillospiraceae bacterium]HPF55935.1 ATP-binding protein [Clostridiales bacterium]HPK36110.1 ATP-binding protein [Oscillospiraceae bacterium]HPR76625.1 ATP-binding protein [Oscillospiraceae bacterium]